MRRHKSNPTSNSFSQFPDSFPQSPDSFPQSPEYHFIIRMYCKQCNKKIFPSPKNSNGICSNCKQRKNETNKKSRKKKKITDLIKTTKKFFESTVFINNFIATDRHNEISKYLFNTKHYLTAFAFLANNHFSPNQNHNEELSPLSRIVEIWNEEFEQYPTTPVEVGNYLFHPSNKTIRKFLIRYMRCKRCKKTLPTYHYPISNHDSSIFSPQSTLEFFSYLENPYQKEQPIPINFQPQNNLLRYSKTCRSCSTSPDGPFWRTIDYFLESKEVYNNKKHQAYQKILTLQY